MQVLTSKRWKDISDKDNTNQLLWPEHGRSLKVIRRNDGTAKVDIAMTSKGNIYFTYENNRHKKEFKNRDPFSLKIDFNGKVAEREMKEVEWCDFIELRGYREGAEKFNEKGLVGIYSEKGDFLFYENGLLSVILIGLSLRFAFLARFSEDLRHAHDEPQGSGEYLVHMWLKSLRFEPTPVFDNYNDEVKL